MNVRCFVTGIYLFIYFTLGQCQGNEPLTLIIENGKFRLPHLIFEEKTTLPITYHYDTSHKLYVFCSSDSANLYLLEEATDPHGVNCSTPTKPTMVKIKNPTQINPLFPEAEIDWYISGYTIHFRNVAHSQTDLKHASSSSSSNPHNHEEKLEVETVPGFILYYSKELKIALAVQYELIKAPTYVKETGLFPSRYHSVKTIDLAPLERLFSAITGVLEVQDHQYLVLTPLVIPAHFIIPLWMDLARFKANLIPIWLNMKKHQIKINDFLQTVAQRVGKLNITSGITNVKSTNDAATNEFDIPEFIWKVVEFYKGETTYGIILVIRNTLGKIEQKICENDVCQQHKWLIRKNDDTNEMDEVYCCNMTQNSIRNLKMDFLQLQETEDFDLGMWDFKSE